MKVTLRMLRVGKNLSLRDVERDFGVSKTVLGRWESGKGLTVRNLMKLLDYYGADLSEVDLSDFSCSKK